MENETAVEITLPATKDEARAIQAKLHTAWWKAYTVRHEVPNGAALEEAVSAELAAFTNAAVEKFGIQSDCRTCRVNSVFGGPGHNASSYCRSGKRPHCTCDTCF